MVIRFFFVQWKRIVRYIPFIIAYIAVMCGLAFVLLTACVNIMTQENLVGKINIGVVLPEDDETARFAVSLVTSMDSVSSMCQFEYMDEKTGRQALKEKKIYALTLIPEHFIEDVMNGTNTPVTIVTMSDNGIETQLFREFADAGVDMLGYAQMAIYAADEYCQQDELLKSMASQINYDLNELYMRYSFNRLDLFEEEKVSATGEASIVEYYLSAGIVLLTMLGGIPFAFYFHQKNDAFDALCSTKGFKAYERSIVTYVVAALLWSIMTVIIYFTMSIGVKYYKKTDISQEVLMACLMMGISVIAFVQMVFSVLKERVWGILTLFFGTIGMMFLSGGFVPSIFLPDLIITFSKCIPTTYWIKCMINGVLEEQTFLVYIICLLWTLVFLIITMISDTVNHTKSLFQLNIGGRR